MPDITDADFYIRRIRKLVKADKTKDGLGTGDLSFRAMYGTESEGGSTATVILDEDMPYTDVSATVFARCSGWGAYHVNVDDVIGVSWGYLFSGIYSLLDGDTQMQVDINGKTYYDSQDRPEGDITNRTKEIIIEFWGKPYGEKKFGGDHETVAGLIDDYADDARGWAIDFMSDIEKMVKS